jgi:hypothetical protein
MRTAMRHRTSRPGGETKVTAELHQATNSGNSKRVAMKQDLEQWDVKENVIEHIERSR